MEKSIMLATLPISAVHNLLQSMRTNTTFWSAVFRAVEMLCSIRRYPLAASSSLCTLPLHNAGTPPQCRYPSTMLVPFYNAASCLVTNTSLLSYFCCWWRHCLLSTGVYFPLSFFAVCIIIFLPVVPITYVIHTWGKVSYGKVRCKER